MYHVHAHAQRGEKRVSDALEQELEAVVICSAFAGNRIEVPYQSSAPS